VSVEWERRGPAAWITFNRPEAHNAMTFAMYEEKQAIFTAGDIDGLATEVVDDAEARVVELCDLLSSHAAVTMRVTKEALRRLRLLPDGDDLVRKAYESDEFRARVRAFLQR
jgi:enoyl-CoA hydratase/carnithine racemase